MTCIFHVDRIEKNAFVFQKQDNIFRLIRFYCRRIPLDTEYWAAETRNIFIDSFKLQSLILV